MPSPLPSGPGTGPAPEAPEEPLDATCAAAWRLSIRAHALLLRALDAELRAAHGMPLLTYDALVQLSEAPGRRMYMKELAAALVYSTSGITRIVDGLERSGYARREPDPCNRRATLVALTEEGLAALEAAWPTHVRGVRRHFARHVGAGQADTLAEVFGAVVDDQEGRPCPEAETGCG
ncbi:MarR family winged helix-turn-helix transcriptional regulator [Streptomyces sp. NPDC089919]|uniref:MarR family winged helix-turn-helix transcriptional regulator n=1 Tax=Streptomyces sp. NPDC089919 TaxID=3155188 RepID=UPI0034469547